VAISFRDLSEFRLDFVTSLLHNLLYQGIFIVFWMSVTSFTGGALGDWAFPDLVVLSAFSLLATAVMQWFSGLLRLAPKVVRGELDKYLAKPVSPLFALLAEEIQGLGFLQQSVSAVVILVATTAYFNLDVSLVSVGASLAVLVVGCLVITLVQGCIGLASFWLGDVSRLHRLVLITGEFERYPLTLFPGWVQGFLTWGMPIGLVSTYPVLVYLDRAEAVAPYLGIGLVLAAAWGSIFRFTWRRALVRYESFGG
jgi:ABC-2 type transport system permease protein